MESVGAQVPQRGLPATTAVGYTVYAIVTLTVQTQGAHCSIWIYTSGDQQTADNSEYTVDTCMRKCRIINKSMTAIYMSNSGGRCRCSTKPRATMYRAVAVCLSRVLISGHVNITVPLHHHQSRRRPQVNQTAKHHHTRGTIKPPARRSRTATS